MNTIGVWARYTGLISKSPNDTVCSIYESLMHNCRINLKYFGRKYSNELFTLFFYYNCTLYIREFIALLYQKLYIHYPRISLRIVHTVQFFLNVTALFNVLCGCLRDCSYGATAKF